MRAMQPTARKQDVKRVFAFRESLLLIDLADPSASLLKGALLQCAVSPAFLVRNPHVSLPLLLLVLSLFVSSATVLQHVRVRPHTQVHL